MLPEDGRRRGGDLCGLLGAPGGGCRAHRLDELPAAVRHAAGLAALGGYTHVDDLEPWALLREAIVPDAAGRFAAAVLRPLREHEERHGGDLIASVRAYLESGENLETAARRLGVHRNTLRRSARRRRARLRPPAVRSGPPAADLAGAVARRPGPAGLGHESFLPLLDRLRMSEG
ncbi:helix-turn-helix domain-containing protein [Nonomuraea ferruginea]